ncbi:unnamed protein product [Ilex paraguariensis]|uniref:Uncharacterized protein n=1 Tax=Ilex paraguariensis TaxID=185542 RepID=A0ABC8QRX1_9AQUA
MVAPSTVRASGVLRHRSPPTIVFVLKNCKAGDSQRLGVLSSYSFFIIKWKAIPIDDKKKMWYASKQKFTLKKDSCIEEAIYQQLKHRLLKNYYCKYATDEIRLQIIRRM